MSNANLDGFRSPAPTRHGYLRAGTLPGLPDGEKTGHPPAPQARIGGGPEPRSAVPMMPAEMSGGVYHPEKMTDERSQDDPERRTVSPPEDLQACVVGLVNAVDKGMAKEVAPYGLTPLEFSLLRICLEAGEEQTATKLAQVLPVDGARISRMVNELVDKGLLRRRRLRTDRRIVMLGLTEEGERLTSRALQSMKRYGASLTEGVSEDEMRVFVAVTSKIIANHAAMQSSG